MKSDAKLKKLRQRRDQLSAESWKSLTSMAWTIVEGRYELLEMGFTMANNVLEDIKIAQKHPKLSKMFGDLDGLEIERCKCIVELYENCRDLNDALLRVDPDLKIEDWFNCDVVSHYERKAYIIENRKKFH